LPPLSLFQLSFNDSKSFPLGKKNYLVFSQDTGSAIKGDLRIDLYLGIGDRAGLLAGELQHKAEMFIFWPKDLPLPKSLLEF
jgi:membrane-bound lytic murein transglycosylase